MGGLRLSLAAAIDHAQSGDGTPIVIRIAHLTPETRITDFSIDQKLYNLPLLVFILCIQQGQCCRINMSRIQLQPDRVVWRQGFFQTRANDVTEFQIGNCPRSFALKRSSER